MTLTATQVASLAGASENAATSALARVGGYIAQDRWLGAQNRYRKNVTQQLYDDCRPAGTVHARQLADYIAASIPLHAADGWSLLGRAMASHLRGDGATARHLAYYAELRAAMALMATQGVGIFQNRHFALHADGSARLVSKDGTHQAAWDILSEWATMPKATQLLGEVLRPANHAMIDWITAIPGGTALQPIATDWLLTFGLDLQILSADRTARNESSYRPTKLRLIRECPINDALEFIVDAWSLLEPSETTYFGSIDRHLLRSTLEKAFVATEGRTPRQAARRYKTMIEAVVTANVDPADQALWSRFLSRTAEPEDPKTIDLMREGGNLDEANQHTRVIARGLLLLRIASGAARKSVLDAGLTMADFGFWWKPFGLDRGLWEEVPEVSELADTWADVGAALTDLETWAANTQPSYSGLLTDCASACTHLAGMEPVALWALAS